MGNRMIKDSIRTSRTVNAMTDFQFRVWVYLITYVDDYGRGSADPELIKGLVFPRRKRLSESDIEKVLAELAGMGCISLYDVDGESYFCFPNWGKHQRIQTKKSKYPSPENGVSQNPTVNHGESPPETKPNRNQIETETEGEGEPPADGSAPAVKSAPVFRPADPRIAAVFTAYDGKIAAKSPLTENIRDKLLVFLDTMGPECCIRAMDEAVEMGKISWRYVETVLKNKQSQGVRCLADWDALEEKRRTAQGGSPALPQKADPNDWKEWSV